MFFSLTALDKQFKKPMQYEIPESIDAALNLLFTSTTKEAPHAKSVSDITTPQAKQISNLKNSHQDTGVLKFAQYLKE